MPGTARPTTTTLPRDSITSKISVDWYEPCFHLSDIHPIVKYRARSLVVNDLPPEAMGFQFESRH